MVYASNLELIICWEKKTDLYIESILSGIHNLSSNILMLFVCSVDRNKFVFFLKFSCTMEDHEK